MGGGVAEIFKQLGIFLGLTTYLHISDLYPMFWKSAKWKTPLYTRIKLIFHLFLGKLELPIPDDLVFSSSKDNFQQRVNEIIFYDS